LENRWKKITEGNPRLLIHLDNSHYNGGDGGRLVDFLCLNNNNYLISIVSDIAVFVLKRDVKLQLTN